MAWPVTAAGPSSAMARYAAAFPGSRCVNARTWASTARVPRAGPPNASRTVVRTPAGDEFEVVDPALAAGLGDGVRVIKQDRGVFDTMPLSIITTRTVAGLGGLAGFDLDVLRFRPNLLIETAGEDAFPEDAWVGCVLRIGGTLMRVDARDKRCLVVNIDPVTTRRDPAILRVIASERQACLGFTARRSSRAASPSATRSSWTSRDKTKGPGRFSPPRADMRRRTPQGRHPSVQQGRVAGRSARRNADAGSR